MSKKSKHKPKGPKNPPQQQPKQAEAPKEEVKEPEKPQVVEQPAQVVVERVQEPVQPPKEEKVQEKPEEKPDHSEPTPTKPKRNRNRKKKNAQSSGDVQEGEEDEEVKQDKIDDKKPVEPEVKAPAEVKENVQAAEVKAEEKVDQPKSKKDKKKDKNVQKSEQATETHEVKSCVLPPIEKKVEEVKSEPTQVKVEVEANTEFVEAKGGKNKKGKNKKGNKDPQSQDDVILPVENIPPAIKEEVKEEVSKNEKSKKPNEKQDEKNKNKSADKKNEQVKEKSVETSIVKPVDTPIEKPVEKVIEKSSEVIDVVKEEIPQPAAETIIPESAPRNKKGKKGEQSKQKQKNDSNSNQLQSDSQVVESTIEKVEDKETNKIECEKSDTCPFKTKEKPKSEAKNRNKTPDPKSEEKILEAVDDFLPSLASSIEKTLEQLIVCESEIVKNEQTKIEDDKKDKNKKKSKKEKEKPSEKIEEKEEIVDKPITQSESKPIESSVEIKMDIPPEEKSKPVQEENKEVVQEKPAEPQIKNLKIEEKRESSKSPSRKDKRKKSPRPPKKEEKPEEVKQEDKIIPPESPICDIPKEEIVCPMKKPEIQDDIKKSSTPERSCESKKKKDKHENKNKKAEAVKEEEKVVIASSVPDDIINALLSDIPPPTVQEIENAKCDIAKSAETIPSAEAKSENIPIENKEKIESAKSEDSCPISKSLPVELPGKIDSNIEKEMKKALEVAIGVIVGGVPIDENKNVLTSEPTAGEETASDKQPDEQKSCEKDNQNKQECKTKSKKNKNKQQHQQQQDLKSVEEKPSEVSEISISPVVAPPPEFSPIVGELSFSQVVAPPFELKPAVNLIAVCPCIVPLDESTDAPSCPISAPVITPTSTETAQLKTSPVVTTSLEDLVIAELPTDKVPPIISAPSDSQSTPKEAAVKQTEENLQQEAIKPPASPKPQKRSKDKKNKGKCGDSKNLQPSDGGQQSQQQSSEQKTSQSGEKTESDKKDSDGDKKKDDKKQNDKSDSKGAKDSQESAEESKAAGEQFEFLPISDACLKSSNAQIKPTEAKSGKDKNKKERKSPPKNQPKNLLGPSNIPAESNKYDYKKEKNKDNIEDIDQNAKIKLRNLDPQDVPEPNQKPGDIKNSCFLPGRAGPSGKKAEMTITELEDGNLDDDDEEFVYKYSFRTVFIANACHICKVALKEDRFVCRFCHLVSYCSEKHRDDDWQTHQSVCYAICTISHAKEQNFIYGDAKGLNGHDYRLLRMQTIVSCEKMLKRKLCPWEQEALLYPRICLTPSCREWKSNLLKDCEGCGQVSYCSANPSHLTADHANWCKSYKLYYKLVAYQLNFGRLEPQLPTKIPQIGYHIPDKSSILFEDLYGNMSNIDECHFATLTQLSTAPLTVLYAYQKFMESNNIIKENMVNGINNSSKQNFCIHLIGAELQFEGDTLKKWEVFFLHLMHHVKELTVVLIGPELNTSKLPVELLSKIKLCPSCRQSNRKIKFDFIENTLYHDYVESQKFIRPDIICAFNPGFHRATGYAGMDTWPETIASALRLRVPVCATAYTSHEMPRDLERVKVCAPHPENLKVIVQPQCNPYASLRPDRNFVSDDEMPLIFKNYHFMVVSG